MQITVQAALREAVEGPVTLRVRILSGRWAELDAAGLPPPTSAPVTSQATVEQVPSEAAPTELPLRQPSAYPIHDADRRASLDTMDNLQALGRNLMVHRYNMDH